MHDDDNEIAELERLAVEAMLVGDLRRALELMSEASEASGGMERAA